ncbi:DUF397 domain-containing protein [Micromonosporaceae bacterium Da 78-11]
MTLDCGSPAWTKSTYCGNTGCVEVANDGETILMRDSKNPDAAPLTFDRAEWTAFIAGVADGEFNPL